MNKSELVDHVANAASLERKAATSAVDAVLDGIVSTIKDGDKVSILGFGVFAPTSRGARTGRNQRTGEPVPVSARNGVRFAPGTPFKASLNANAKSGAKKAGTATKSSPAKATKAASKPTSGAATKASKAPAKVTKSAKKG